MRPFTAAFVGGATAFYHRTMKSGFTLAAVLAVLAVSGCASSRVSLGSDAPASMRGAPPAGASYSTVSIHAEARPNAYFGLLLFGYAVAGMHETYSGEGGAAGERRPPQLAEDRAIAERDCSRPMQLPSANLRCK